MFDECVIDASMGVSGGMLCFCPIERGPDGEISNIIIGMNFVGAPPRGSRVVAVVHENGQEAVEAFCAEHKHLIDEAFKASAIEAQRDATTEIGAAEGESAMPKADAKGDTQ
jgi:hypothetical protein